MERFYADLGHVVKIEPMEEILTSPLFNLSFGVHAVPQQVGTEIASILAAVSSLGLPYEVFVGVLRMLSIRDMLSPAARRSLRDPASRSWPEFVFLHDVLLGE